MKKFISLMALLFVTLTASAQFEKDKIYLGGSLTGFNLSYNGSSKLNLGLNAMVGYMVEDNWMVHANVGIQANGAADASDMISAGGGIRYYIEQNGIFLGANAKLMHGSHGYNDLMPGVECGYAFFLNRSVTVEPALYYQQSFKNHSDYSTIGVKIGLGVYF